MGLQRKRWIWPLAVAHACVLASAVARAAPSEPRVEESPGNDADPSTTKLPEEPAKAPPPQTTPQTTPQADDATGPSTPDPDTRPKPDKAGSGASNDAAGEAPATDGDRDPELPAPGESEVEGEVEGEGEGEGEGENPEPEPDEDEVERKQQADEGSLGTLSEPGTVNVEETIPDAPARWPRRLGPARITIDKAGDSLSLGLATQLLGEGDVAFTGPYQSQGWDGGITINRLRLVMGSRFLDGRVRSSVQLNFAPGALELIDVWFLYAPLPKLALRIGQFKVPYTRYRAQSFAALSLVDWSPVTRMFGSERQIGLEFLNPAPDDLSWEFAAGIFAGTNVRASHGVGLVEEYGETPVNRSDLTSFRVPSSFHPELVGRVAKNFGAIDTAANTDIRGGPFRSSVGLSGAWDTRPVAKEDLTGRIALEWLAKVHHVHINAVGHLGWFGGAADIGPWGAMGEVGYRFHRRWELTGRYSWVGIGRRLRDDARAHADEAIRDAMDGDVLAQYALVGRVRSRNELATSASMYVVGHSLKAQIEAAWVGEDTELGWRQSVATRFQLQFQY